MACKGQSDYVPMWPFTRKRLCTAAVHPKIEVRHYDLITIQSCIMLPYKEIITFGTTCGNHVPKSFPSEIVKRLIIITFTFSDK